MYYVTTKTVGGSNVKFICSAEKRDTARTLAAQHNGTVRTQADMDKLLASNAVTDLPKAGFAKSVNIVAEVKAPVTIADIAADVAKTVKSRKTMGKKEKGAKRVETTEAVLTEARAFLMALPAETTKVGTVRALAAWVAADGSKLARRDAIKLLHTEQPDWNIAVHTVSTQWQLIRSGKLKSSETR